MESTNYREGEVTEAKFLENAQPVPYGAAEVQSDGQVMVGKWYEQQVQYERGDKVTLQSGQDGWQITGYARSEALSGLFFTFVVVVVLIARVRGLMSLLALAGSFLILFYYTIPAIAGGQNPIVTAILTSAGIVGITFYLAHGLNRKTHAAALGTMITLVVVTALVGYVAEIVHLTGYAREDAVFLANEIKGVSIGGILIAGMVLGSVGILDDITISQAGIVTELWLANKQLSRFELFQRAMRVGRDHIASLVNTLVLVYTGSALPLILLFHLTKLSYREFVNYEAVAEEIVRMLIGSIGLVLAVPLSTIIAVLLVVPSRRLLP